MNRLLKTEGIIIRKFPLNDFDLILTVLSRDLGKISCLAKGARRMKSKFSGKTELFQQVRLVAFRGKSFYYIDEINVLNSPEQKDLGSISRLFYLGEITNKLMQEDHLIPGIYELFTETIKKADCKISFQAYLVKLLTILGYMGHWNTCVDSDEKINLEKPIYLSGCALSQVEKGRVLPIALVKWVNFMQKYPLIEIRKVKISKNEEEAVWQIIQWITRESLQIELKSEEFLQKSSI